MSDPFVMPPKGSPLDVARNIASNEEVTDAIENLIDVIREVAQRENGLSYAVFREAVDIEAVGSQSLSELIVSQIESRFEEALRGG